MIVNTQLKKRVAYIGIMILMMLTFYTGSFMGTLSGLLIAVPTILYTLKAWQFQVIVDGLIAVLIAGIFIPVFYSGLFLAFSLAMGLTMAYGLRAKFKSTYIVFGGTLGGSLALGGFYLYLQQVAGAEISLLTQQITREILQDEFLMQAMSPEVAKRTLEFMGLIIPSLMILTALVYSWINFLLASIFIRKWDMIPLEKVPFHLFTFERETATAGSLMLLGSWLMASILPIDDVMIQANFLMLFFIVFYIQAMAMFYGIGLKKVKKIFAIIFTILAMIFIPFPFFSSIGFLDALFNFRKLKR